MNRGKGPQDSYSRYPMSGKELIRYGGIAVLLTAAVAYLFYDSLWVFLFAVVPAAAVFLKEKRKQLIAERKERLKRQFLSAGELLCDYLRSGYAVEPAVSKSVRELEGLWGGDSDIVREWRVIAAGLSYNHPVEELFRTFADRADVQEIRDFAEIFSIVNRSGGQLTDVLKARTDMMKEEFAVEEQIETMLTAKKFEQKIMDLMPMLILLYIRLTSPELLSVLYTTLAGRLAATAALGIYAGAFFLAERIIRGVKV